MMSSGIGNFLRQYRQNNNLSRESFAEMLDISAPYPRTRIGAHYPRYSIIRGES